ncbi:hypothetical protein BHE74_00045104 [Ensete ventricosum]|nr:hypothetical protein BHE74_00045104 [Ensete ventricosum]
MVTGRVVIPRGVMPSPVNSVRVETMERRYSFPPDLKVISGSGSYLDLFSITARTYALCAEEMSPPEAGLIIFALDTAICSSRTKGDPLVELSPSSSFDLKNSFWTSFIHRFISRSCTRSESVESEERVFGSSMLWTEVLMLGACRFATFLRGLEGARGEVMGPPHQVTIGPRAALVRVMPPIVPLYRFAVVASAAASAEACVHQKKTETRQKIVRGSRKAYRDSLGDSPKGSESSLGTRREIARRRPED